MKRTWDIAHICGWAQGGPPDLYNVFPCCQPCNRQAENGGRRAGQPGINHFDGIVLEGFGDVRRYGWLLASFLDRAYEWLFVTGTRDRDAVPYNEDRATVLTQWYGPGVPGGFKDERVLITYATWRQTYETIAIRSRNILALKLKHAEIQGKLTEAKEAIDAAVQDLAAFKAQREHYLERRK